MSDKKQAAPAATRTKEERTYIVQRVDEGKPRAVRRWIVQQDTDKEGTCLDLLGDYASHEAAMKALRGGLADGKGSPGVYRTAKVGAWFEAKIETAKKVIIVA